MQVQWVSKKKVSWLGAVSRLGEVPALQLKAKALLLSWKNLYGNVPVTDYGTSQDLTGYWSARDQAMMDAFVDYWTALNGQPVTFKQLPADTPTTGQVAALEAWAKGFVQPGQFPPFGGSAPLPGTPPQIPGLPQVPAGSQACVDTCLQATGVPPNSPGYVFNLVNCIAQCGGPQPPVNPADVRVTPNQAPTTPATDTSSNTLPLVIGGLIVVGIGAALFLGAPKLQENFYVGVGATAGMGRPRKRRRKR